jgi:hypothetical protein
MNHRDVLSVFSLSFSRKKISSSYPALVSIWVISSYSF